VIGIGGSITDKDIEDAKAQWEEAESETEPPPPVGAPVSEKPVGDSDQINQIVTGSYDGSQASADSISKTLVDYSEVIDDWAEMVGKKMFAQVEQEEWKQWRSVSEEIGAGLRDVMGNTPVGQVAQDIVYRQIQLMKSLPLEQPTA
jgi:hypothetical protein